MRTTRPIWTSQKYLSFTWQNRISTLSEKPKFSEEWGKIKPLKQKTKDRLTVIGILALESGFIYDSIDNFYKYILLKMPFNLLLAILSTFGTAILLVFIILILISYLDKRKVLRSFQKMSEKRTLILFLLLPENAKELQELFYEASLFTWKIGSSSPRAFTPTNHRSH